MCGLPLGACCVLMCSAVRLQRQAIMGCGEQTQRPSHSPSTCRRTCRVPPAPCMSRCRVIKRPCRSTCRGTPLLGMSTCRVTPRPCRSTCRATTRPCKSTCRGTSLPCKSTCRGTPRPCMRMSMCRRPRHGFSPSRACSPRCPPLIPLMLRPRLLRLCRLLLKVSHARLIRHPVVTLCQSSLFWTPPVAPKSDPDERHAPGRCKSKLKHYTPDSGLVAHSGLKPSATRY